MSKHDSRFLSISREILAFMQESVWTLGLDPLLFYEMRNLSLDAQVEELRKFLEADTKTKEEWSALPLVSDGSVDTAVAEKGAEPKYDPSLVVRRIRSYGIQKTRSYLIGSILRRDIPSLSKSRSENRIEEPLSLWSLSGKVVGESESMFDFRLETAVVLEIFFAWLNQSKSASEPGRAKKWIEKQSEFWVALRNKLERESKEGVTYPWQQILKTQILYDLGRATVIACTESVADFWGQANKEKYPDFIPLWQESEAFGFNSAQFGVVWSQVLVQWSGLSTPVRMMMRPWRRLNPLVMNSHRIIIDYLIKSQKALVQS